ncbi:hypothetical protein [Microbacterium sp. CIAB417]|uniref:hypothetical protein n=1 Tax=Microbacterium sp. CIAB417 TaxID=2860287 RepID=UPI001FAE1440|nr:hypothetical protein [Microbacterium sp. CIAB417]
MSIANQISLSLDVLMQNITRLQEQAATLPTPDEISTTEGSTKEKAQADYVDALKRYADRVAKKTELVKLYVQTNAEALQKASEALLTTDGNTSLEARQAAAFIEAATAAPQDAPGKQVGGPMTERTW